MYKLSHLFTLVPDTFELTFAILLKMQPCSQKILFVKLAGNSCQPDRYPIRGLDIDT
jgi:hypothetical protein